MKRTYQQLPVFLNNIIQIWATVSDVDKEQKMLDLLLKCKCGQFEVREVDYFLKKTCDGFK